MSSEFFEGFTNIQIDHTRRCTVSYPQENTIELCGVPFNKKERMYMCVLKCHTIERSLYRLRCCKDHCWMQKRAFGIVCDPKL